MSDRIRRGGVVVALASLVLAMVQALPVYAAAPAPDGRISMATLREATLDVPAWPADNVQGPSGKLRFHQGLVTIEPTDVTDGQPPYGTDVRILAVTYGDIDHDGRDETIVELGCLIEGGSKQLVAYDRDRDGRIVSLGRVVTNTGEIRDIKDGSARVSADGVVTVRVADYQLCCADQTPQTWQTRGYALRGDHFTQVSGPRRMPLNRHVTDVQVTMGDLTLGRPSHGYRSGTVKVTVTHIRGFRPSQVKLTFTLPEGLVGPNVVTVAAPPTGGSMTYSYTFRRPATLTGGDLSVEVTTVPALNPTVPWHIDATTPIRTAD